MCHIRVQACQREREDKRVNFLAAFYLLFIIQSANLANIRALCQVATKGNSSADLQQSCLQNEGRGGGRNPQTSPPLKPAGFLSELWACASATVPLRCLIDRGCVKSDSLFCSTPRWPALPCLRCFEKQVVYPNTGVNAVGQQRRSGGRSLLPREVKGQKPGSIWHPGGCNAAAICSQVQLQEERGNAAWKGEKLLLP